MGSSKTLKETVERAQKEVKKLLEKTRLGKLDMNRLELGLKEVRSDLKVLDFHLDKQDGKQDGKQDAK
jgi:hypothetical protein